jgi:hypothetical protein
MAHEESSAQIDPAIAAIYDTAVTEIHARAEAGEEDISQRILRPVYEAALSSVDPRDSSSGSVKIGTVYTQHAKRLPGVIIPVLRELQGAGELSQEDSWEEADFDGFPAVFYKTQSGDEYIFDHMNGYIGPVENHWRKGAKDTLRQDTFENAKKEIYARAEAGEEDLSKRVLQPILDASIAAARQQLAERPDPRNTVYPGSFPSIANRFIGSTIDKLQEAGELSYEDAIWTEDVNKGWVATFYRNEAGEEFILDCLKGYAGPPDEGPIEYLRADDYAQEPGPDGERKGGFVGTLRRAGAAIVRHAKDF